MEYSMQYCLHSGQRYASRRDGHTISTAKGSSQCITRAVFNRILAHYCHWFWFIWKAIINVLVGSSKFFGPWFSHEDYILCLQISLPMIISDSIYERLVFPRIHQSLHRIWVTDIWSVSPTQASPNMCVVPRQVSPWVPRPPHTGPDWCPRFRIPH